MSDPIYLINSRFIDIRRWYVLSENVLIYKWLFKITLQIYTRDWLTTNQYGIVPATKLNHCCAKKKKKNSQFKFETVVFVYGHKILAVFMMLSFVVSIIVP